MDDLVGGVGDRLVERLHRFLLCIERLARERPRPFKRRMREVGPVALQIRVPVGRAGNLV